MTLSSSYLSASSASAYSLISMLQHFGPMMPAGGSVVSLTYLASERVVPGYGGGMSSAKAQLESDTKVLAWEAGRKWGVRVNTISAGPLASRAAIAIKKVHPCAPPPCSAASTPSLHPLLLPMPPFARSHHRRLYTPSSVMATSPLPRCCSSSLVLPCMVDKWSRELLESATTSTTASTTTWRTLLSPSLSTLTT
eukprot:751849-Hanusia_phi.AAC.4